MNDNRNLKSLILVVVIMTVIIISVACGVVFLAGEFDQQYVETIVIKDVHDLGSDGVYSIVSANNTEYLTYYSYIYMFALENEGKEVEIIYTANGKECKIKKIRLARLNKTVRCNMITCKGVPV